MKNWGWASVGLAVVLSVASSARADELSNKTNAKPKNIRIPVTVAEADRSSFESFNLFVSLDRGKTWKLAQTITPDKLAFHFKPDGQGTCWLACQTVGKDGRKFPESIVALMPAIAVTVEGDNVTKSKP